MCILEKKVVNNKIVYNVVTNRVKFLKGWQIIINLLFQLWDDISPPNFSLCT